MKECKEREQGFTLIELLITIVVVGVVTAVAIVGAGGLVEDGSEGACQTSADAARSAAMMHFSNIGTYPDEFSDMSGSSPKMLDVPTNVTINATTLVKGPAATPQWTVTMTGGGTSAIDFECS